MIFFICLAIGIGVVAALDVEDCKHGATFTFRQGCFECWCRNGKPTCSNVPHITPSGVICNWTDDDNEEDIGADKPRKKTHHAAGIKPWDLDFTKRRTGSQVPPYPISNPYQNQQVSLPMQHYRPYPLIYQQSPLIYRGDTPYPQFWGRRMKNGHHLGSSKSKRYSNKRRKRSDHQ